MNHICDFIPPGWPGSTGEDKTVTGKIQASDPMSGEAVATVTVDAARYAAMYRLECKARRFVELELQHSVRFVTHPEAAAEIDLALRELRRALEAVKAVKA